MKDNTVIEAALDQLACRRVDRLLGTLDQTYKVGHGERCFVGIQLYS